MNDKLLGQSLNIKKLIEALDAYYSFLYSHDGLHTPTEELEVHPLYKAMSSAYATTSLAEVSEFCKILWPGRTDLEIKDKDSVRRQIYFSFNSKWHKLEYNRDY